MFPILRIEPTQPLKIDGPPRNLLIDYLRGISIILVLICHSDTIGFAFPYGSKWLRFLSAGQYGVCIFFVISGFLITRNCLKRYAKLGNIQIRDFYVMRFARIIPALVLTLALASTFRGLGLPKFVGDFDPWDAAWMALTFRYNYFYQHYAVPGAMAWSILWSLSIEEMFYLIFPIVCVVMRRTDLIIASLILIIMQAPFDRADWGQLYVLRGCADLLAMGCLTALIAHKVNLGKMPNYVWVLIRGLGLVIVWYVCQNLEIHDYKMWGPSFVGLGAALYLFASTQGSCRLFDNYMSKITNMFLKSTLGFLGKKSYELYLFHVIIGFIVSYYLTEIKLQPMINFCIGFSSIFIFSSIVGHFYTEPLNIKLRKYLN